MTSRTIHRIYITFPKPKVGFSGNPDYPLCVTVNGGQENLVRSMRDARIFANGAMTGILFSSTTPVDPVIEVDPRLVHEDS